MTILPALRTLQDLGDASVLPELEEIHTLYSQPDDFFIVRLHLERTMAGLGDNKSFERLEQALRHEDGAVRRIGAKMLGQLGEQASDSAPAVAEAIQQETDPYAFGQMRKALEQMGALTDELAALERPTLAPAPADTYGKPRVVQLTYDDCATVEAMKRFVDLSEEIYLANNGAPLWTFTMFYAPLSRNDHEMHKVLVQRLFDRGCGVQNHTLRHNPDGRSLYASSDDQIREMLAGCNEWLRENIYGLDKIYRYKGGGGGYRRPIDPQRNREDVRAIFRESGFNVDVDYSWDDKGRFRVDLAAPPYHEPEPEGWSENRPEGAPSRMQSAHATSDLTHAYDYDTVEEGVAAFAESFDHWYFHEPQVVFSVPGHDWPSAPYAVWPGHEKHWEIMSGFHREVLVHRKERYPLIFFATELETKKLFNEGLDVSDLLSRDKHIQTE